MNAQPRNVMRICQPHVRPTFATVDGFPHAITMRNIAAHCDFTTADVNDIFIPFTDGNRTYRTAKIFVGNVTPSCTRVIRFPNSTAGRAEVISRRIADHTSNRRRSPAAERPDVAVFQTIKKFGRVSFGLRISNISDLGGSNIRFLLSGNAGATRTKPKRDGAESSNS